MKGKNIKAISEKHPQISYALGVHDEATARQRTEDFKAMGINARHERDKDGNYPLHIYSDNARNGVMKSIGVSDRDGGYGQYTGS